MSHKHLNRFAFFLLSCLIVGTPLYAVEHDAMMQKHLSLKNLKTRTQLDIGLLAILLILTSGLLQTIPTVHAVSFNNSQSPLPPSTNESKFNETIHIPIVKPVCPSDGSIPGLQCGTPGNATLVGVVDASKIPPLREMGSKDSFQFIGGAGSLGSSAGSMVKFATFNGADPPPTVNANFAGINGACNACVGDPPDVQVAAGPNQVMEMVNVGYQVFSKSGVALTQVLGAGSLFKIPSGDFFTDPRILFDPLSGRWFGSISDATGNFVSFGVSTTNDPTGTWTIYKVTAACPQFDNCTPTPPISPDQPHIGVSNDKFVVSVNAYAKPPIGNTFCQCAQYWVINKRQMTEAASSPSMQSFGPDSNTASIVPAQSLTSTDGEYMVSTGVTPTGGTTNIATVYKITGLPPNAGATPTQYTLASISNPPQATQPGGSTVWGSGKNDARVQTAEWFNGEFWFALNEGCINASHVCIRLDEISTTTGTLVQDFDFSRLNAQNNIEDLYYPAITIDGMGNMALVYGYSDTNDYPTVAVTEQAVTDGINFLETPQILASGNEVSNSGRYGDYFGAGVDPANTTRVWIAGEYMNSNAGLCGSTNCYSTQIAELTTTGFTSSSDLSTLTLQRGSSGTSLITLSSSNAYTGQAYLSPQAVISINAVTIDDNFPRAFGLLFDQTLNPDFWNSQPSSVIGSQGSPFNYGPHTYALSTGTHFLEFGVSAFVGQWRAQINVNGMVLATIDTDVSHHVHIVFQVGGATWSGPQGATPPVATDNSVNVLQPSSTVSTTYQVATSSSTGTGLFTMAMSASIGYQLASFSRQVNVIDFSVTANPTSASLVLASASTTSTITVSSQGDAGTVSLTSSVSPTGPVISLWPVGATVSNGGSATSTLSISTGGAIPGTYTATVVGAMQSASTLTAVYQPGNPDTDLLFNNRSVGQGVGEAFNSTLTGTVTSITVQLRRTGGSSVTSGHFQALIYAAGTGTYGTNMIGQTPALATGDAFDITTVPNDFNYHTDTLTFSGANQITLNAGTKYVFILDLTDIATDGSPTSGISMGAHTDGTGYSGNVVGYDSNANTWSTVSTYDTIFQVATTATITHSTTVAITIGGDFSISANPTSLSIKVGKSGTSTLTFTSLPAFNGLSFAGNVSISNQASISLTATDIDDGFCRSFGLLFDQTLNPDFWNSQPSSVINPDGCNVVPYSHTYTLSSGSHFLEFGVSAFVGHWHVQIAVNGVVLASVDTYVNGHVHAAFSLGGITITPVVSGGPTVSLSASNVVLAQGGSGMITLTVSTTHSTPRGTYTVTVTATSAGLSHSATVTVTVA